MTVRFHTAVAIAALMAAVPALAQPAGVFLDAQTQDQYLARDNLIGAKVHGSDGKIIADVEDLIINDQNQVVGVVVGSGGVLGMGEKKIGLSLSALKFEEKDGKTIVTLPEATAATLAAAPDYKRTAPAKTLMERAREKALEFTDKTTATTKDAYEKAKPALDDAKRKAEEAYEKAKEAAEPALESAKKAAQEAVDAAREAVAPAATETPPAASETPPPAAETPPAAPAPAEPTPETPPPAQP